MSASREVIVIGAGIIGASIAWHLTKAGAKVTILDAAEPGGIATPCSFGWINASWGNPEPYYRLRIRAMAEWKRLAAEIADLPVAWHGGLCWDKPRAELEADAARHACWGYGVREVDRQAAAQIEPHLASPPEFALFVAEEGAAEPVAVTRMLIADAVHRGALLSTGSRVTSISPRKNGSATVETEAGRLEANDIVLAAGAGSAALAASAGFDLEMKAPPGLIIHSRPHAKLLNGLVLGSTLHMRQTEEGRIIAGADYGGV